MYFMSLSSLLMGSTRNARFTQQTINAFEAARKCDNIFVGSKYKEVLMF